MSCCSRCGSCYHGQRTRSSLSKNTPLMLLHCSCDLQWFQGRWDCVKRERTRVLVLEHPHLHSRVLATCNQNRTIIQPRHAHNFSFMCIFCSTLTRMMKWNERYSIFWIQEPVSKSQTNTPSTPQDTNKGFVGWYRILNTEWRCPASNFAREYRLLPSLLQIVIPWVPLT